MDIVVHLPTSPALSAQGFEFDSAFPGRALLECVPALVNAAAGHPDARLLLFGHADEAGSESYNKELSDRRANAMFAMLTQDLSLLDQVAGDDGWKLIQYQAIMATLGIAPMDVDGKPGPKTTKGVQAFQRAYNAGTYHARALRERAAPELKVDGELGARTESALRDAYLALVTVKLEPGRFFGPKTAGCGEFNRMGAPARDRRVALALYRPDFPTESKIPCKAGEVESCKINREAQHPWKCNFYRRTLESETPVASKPRPAPAPDGELGHLCLRFYSPKGKPLFGPTAKIVAGGPGAAEEKSLLADAALEWADLPLDHYTVELTLGSAKLAVSVPWLHANDPVQHQCVRELDTLLAQASAVGAAQVRLLGLGYDCGGADGQLGPKTSQAIKRFQRSYGLPEDGTLSEATSSALRRHFGA
jgi:peptidoglycan hydrolase-like protein with peptidoglycan-binding domain